MREKRRLKLTERQTMLARVARREAMMSLAGTLDEEAKSAALAQRSRELARDYSSRTVTGIAADLGQLSALASGLAGLAKDADGARDDARQQVDWQVEELARTDTRLKRLEERAKAAQRALRMVGEARAAPASEGMARKLLNVSDTPTGKVSDTPTGKVSDAPTGNQSRNQR